MRSHGTGNACYDLRLPTKCDACRQHAARVKRESGTKPGSYRYKQIHDPNSTAYTKAVIHARLYRRRGADARDAALLGRSV